MTRFPRFIAALSVVGLAAGAAPLLAQAGAAGAPTAQGDQPRQQQQQQQQPPHQEQHHPDAVQTPDTAAPAQGQTPGQMHAQMMAMRQQMMADLQAGDARIDELLARVRNSTGDAKLDAMADLLTEMVEQRRTMRHGLMEMQSQMMGQMQHMQMMMGNMGHMMGNTRVPPPPEP